MHVTRSISTLSMIAAGLLAMTGPVSVPVQAQSTWTGGTPIYDSEVQQKAQQTEAERAERRKTYGPVVYPKFMQGGERPDLKPLTPSTVYFDQAEEPGSIIIDTQGKKLYYVLPDKKAFEYPISVGRDGFTWSGSERISRIAEWPSWTPPPEMHKRVPGLPITVTGGLRNPQGARALYLGNTIYRIHGTNNHRTVGRNNSSGCFRLINEHVVHLASIAKVGTKVKVLQAYNGGVSQNAPLSSLFGFGASGEPTKSTAKAKPSKPLVKRAAGAPAPVAAAEPAVAPTPAPTPPAAQKVSEED